MSEQLREEAQFRRGKTPIVLKYLGEHAGLMAAIAGRGFSYLPGHAYDMESTLEAVTKDQLAELNYKILAETIERELKQTGLDYDVDLRNAIVQWEIDKQALLDDWDKELAAVKQGMANREEELDRLEIEVDARGNYLIEQKTALEVQAEAYRLILAGLNDSAIITAKTAIDLQAEGYRLTMAGLNDSVIIEEQSAIRIAAEALRKMLASLSDADIISEKTALEITAEAYRTTMAGINDAPIITAKTVIDLAAEAYRTTMATLDGTVAPYEVSLAAAKLATAERKLDLIPILLQIVDKEQELIVQEQGKTTAYTALMEQEREVANKRRDRLVPVIADLVSTGEQYADEIHAQSTLEQQIADQKVTQAEMATENAQARSTEAGLESDYHDKVLLLQDARQDLSDARNETETVLAGKDLANTDELRLEETAANADILNEEEGTQTYVLSKKRQTANKADTTRLTSSNTISDAERDTIWDKAVDRAQAIQDEAQAKAESAITAQLTHLIG
jgi:uncharacterized protein (DUF1778 family)